uniref:Uncharacterized protein n=1 Tax=Avena sativa TaxID=4498 RepID=A0ACD5YCM9_AVESA
MTSPSAAWRKARSPCTKLAMSGSARFDCRHPAFGTEAARQHLHLSRRAVRSGTARCIVALWWKWSVRPGPILPPALVQRPYLPPEGPGPLEASSRAGDVGPTTRQDVGTTIFLTILHSYLSHTHSLLSATTNLRLQPSPSLYPNMAKSGPQQWKDLPTDLLTEIARRLPCFVDRFYMSWACHDWWFVVQRPPSPRQLPWLLLPDPTTMPHHLLPGTGNTRKVSFYCLLCNTDTHNIHIRHAIGGARFFGSYDGGWLLLAHGQTNGHTLLNLHTDRCLFLPDHAICVQAPVGRVVHPPAVVSIAILAATFSSTPRPTERCFGAGIVDTSNKLNCPQIALWRMEGAVDRHPVAMSLMGNYGGRFEDVIYHQGAFRFLTDAEDIFVYDVSKFQEDEEGKKIWSELGGNRQYFLQGPPRSSNGRVTARYLVESRGELLMILRLVRWVRRTWAFEVYRVTQHLNSDGLVQPTWTELSSLDGRILFVARGCSRAYEVADFPCFAFEEGIYFLDDRNSNDVVAMSRHGILGRHTSSGNGCVEQDPFRGYTCCDNGRCRWVEGMPGMNLFRLWFPNKERSNYSSPIWFIP